MTLCAATCLFIAAKSNESDQNIPTSLDLHKHMVGPDVTIPCEYECSSPMITRCERQILNGLNWNLDTVPSFYPIVNIFRAQGVLFSCDSNLGEITLHSVNLVDKYIDLFCVIVLQEATLVGMNPYILACAVIAASRACSEVVTADSMWPEELHKLSGLNL